MSNKKAVKQAEANLEHVRNEAEVLVQQVNNVVPLYATEFAQYLMQDAVTRNPEVTLSLGEVVLGELKDKFNETLKTIPSESEHRLKSIQWPHREQPPSEYDYSAYVELAKKTRKSLDEVIRDLVGGLGALLLQYGYERKEEGLEPRWQVGTRGAPRYSYSLPDGSLPGAKEFHKLAERYDKLITDDYQKAVTALNNAIGEKKAAEAQALWDNA
jgi:hypothetical protein